MTTRSSKTPQEILLGAAEIIQRDGWHQGDLYVRPGGCDQGRLMGSVEYNARDEEASRTSPVCAVGAITRSTCGRARWSVDATTKAAELKGQRGALWLLERHLGTDGIPEWNDHPSRTAEDVILAMKHAASLDAEC